MFRDNILKLLALLIGQFKTKIVSNNLQTPAGKRLYETALAAIGQDLTPKDEVPDEVACMATINVLHQRAFGEPIGGDASTYLGYLALKSNQNWVLVTSPLPGDIIVSPTGFNDEIGKKNGITNGHIGCFLTNNQIASNNSKTGLFTAGYDLWTWKYRYQTMGRFPVYIFRKVV